MSSTKLVFLRPIEKTRWPPWPLIGWDIFDFSSKTAEQISMAFWQEARSQHPLQSFAFLADRKNKMAALASDLLTHFRLLLWNHWTQFNKTWQEARSECPLPRLCFSGQSEKHKMTALASDWLTHLMSDNPKVTRHTRQIWWNLLQSGEIFQLFLNKHV